MPRGPKPKPTALRLLHGDRKDRINLDEPVPRDVLPTAPKTMSPEVREVWDYTLNELKHMRLATGADRDTLVAYCEAVVAHRQASQLLAKSSVLVPGLNGMVRNPAFHVQRDAANTIRVFAAEFGLTPSARSRIRMEERAKTGGGEGNPFAAVANG